MDDGQEDVDECGCGEEPVDEAEEHPQKKSALIDHREDCEINEREYKSENEMRQVAKRLRADPILAQRCPEKKRQIDARQPQLAGRTQRCREDKGADDP